MPLLWPGDGRICGIGGSEMNPWMVSEMPVVDSEGVETCVVFCAPPFQILLSVGGARVLASDLMLKADDIDPPPRRFGFWSGWMAASLMMIVVSLILWGIT